MELQLFRVDYIVVGVTGKNCLKLLPPSRPKEQQKVAIGDSDGILQVFSIKKDDIQWHFKTLPSPSIASLKLGGASGAANDRIFIATRNEVKGYTKKGKLFLVFDSGMIEDISSMFVLDNELFLCGKHVYSHFRDCKDVGSYLCGDTIVDVIAFYMAKTKRLTSLIACEGRVIRMLEHARVISSMEVESSPTVLHLFEDNKTKTVLFGTIDGRLGVVDVESLPGFRRWLLSNDKNTSPILCMDSYDMTGSGKNNLILGRQDGNIEIYTVNIQDEMDAAVLLFIENCNESIMSLECGIVGTNGYDEVLIVTYSGRVIGFTSQVAESNFDGTTGSYVFSNDASTRINKLKVEIEELQAKVAKEREKYQDSTLNNSLMELSAISLIPITSTFTLDRNTATYLLTLEAPTAIDNILIKCDINVKLLDVEKNTAVISHSESNHSKISPGVLATYRCQINTNHIELKIQTTESEIGVLQVYISPVLQPKCSRLLQFNIKALSLHYRISEYKDIDRPYSSLKLQGSFSLAEVHNWLKQCLPEVPEKPDASNETEIYFQSCILDTILICTYKKAQAEFKSDNIMSLHILKEILSIEATKRKTKIEINLQVGNDCIYHILKIVQPKLEKCRKLLKDVELYNALNELEIPSEENNAKYLSEKYRNILNSKSELNEREKGNCNFFERLHGCVISLYISFNKLKGLQQGLKIEQLKEHLKNHSYDKLIDVFQVDS